MDRFFQFSLLGLLLSGFLAVAGSGYLDTPTLFATATALALRALLAAGVVRVELPPAVVTALTLGYIGFYPIDYFFISKSFIPAAVHLVFDDNGNVILALTGEHTGRATDTQIQIDRHRPLVEALFLEIVERIGIQRRDHG